MPSTNSTTLEKPGNCLYYSCLFLSEQQKKQLAPLLSFIWRTERIPRFSHEPEVITTQLSWWQKEIALGFEHRATHPLVIEFIQNIENLNPHKKNPQLAQQAANNLVSGLSYSINQQQDCQINDATEFTQHALSKRQDLVNLASALIDVEPLQQNILSLVCELLTSIDIVDGFHRDAATGIISLPLDFLIQHEITVDELTDSNSNNQQFWKQWLNRNLHIYQQLWSVNHPLIEVIIIYSGLRLIAFKKSLIKSSKTINNCYNSRPNLTPLQKFWFSWRLHSRWSSGKTSLRNLIP